MKRYLLVLLFFMIFLFIGCSKNDCNHDYIEVIDKEPTCLENGLAHKEGKKCEYKSEQYEISLKDKEEVCKSNELLVCDANFNNRLSIDNNGLYGLLPSIGFPKVLVIPINLDDNNATNEVLNDINTVFNSENSEFESVKLYYKKSSYGKLDLTFDILDWYKPSNSAFYYSTIKQNNMDGSKILLLEALNSLDDKIDYSDYDYDNDGYIDGVIMVYNNEVDHDFYWAYVQGSIENKWNNEKFDNLYINYFGLFGSELMYKNNNITSEKYIHEVGHLLGLDDYYNLTDSNRENNSMFYTTMMDYNNSDLLTIDKLLLGWINPTVISGSGEVELNLSSFVLTGKCLLITKNNINDIYNEYFLIDFYTLDGLNQYKSNIISNGINYGVRIIHVDATLNKEINNLSIYKSRLIESIYKYNNTDTNHKFCELLRSDNISSNFYMNSLYNENSLIFGLDKYKDFKLNDGTNLFFTLKVESCSIDGCSLTITLN